MVILGCPWPGEGPISPRMWKHPKWGTWTLTTACRKSIATEKRPQGPGNLLKGHWDSDSVVPPPGHRISKLSMIGYGLKTITSAIIIIIAAIKALWKHIKDWAVKVDKRAGGQRQL